MINDIWSLGGHDIEDKINSKVRSLKIQDPIRFWSTSLKLHVSYSGRQLY